MAEATLKRTIVAAVHDRVKTGKCLHCDDKATRRGLCMRHYLEFRRNLFRQPVRERCDFELDNIRDGNILPQHYARKVKYQSPFAKATD